MDHVSDSFLETNVPLLVLIEAAKNGNEKEVKDYAQVFREHANKLIEVRTISPRRTFKQAQAQAQVQAQAQAQSGSEACVVFRLRGGTEMRIRFFSDTCSSSIYGAGLFLFFSFLFLQGKRKGL